MWGSGVALLDIRFKPICFIYCNFSNIFFFSHFLGGKVDKNQIKVNNLGGWKGDQKKLLGLATVCRADNESLYLLKGQLGVHLMTWGGQR